MRPKSALTVYKRVPIDRIRHVRRKRWARLSNQSGSEVLGKSTPAPRGGRPHTSRRARPLSRETGKSSSVRTHYISARAVGAGPTADGGQAPVPARAAGVGHQWRKRGNVDSVGKWRICSDVARRWPTSTLAVVRDPPCLFTPSLLGLLNSHIFIYRQRN
jgi:hypothetical protein